MPPSNPFNTVAYDTVFNNLYEPLCRFCIRMVHDKESAEDIVQEQLA
ncbi:MAG: hypothetical protein PF517_05540 [Salinivirgaceae bacterium]|jgi:DNA-directed RNA polymerase specialized sigma24 family protein|nr:hypothetical protein [Salinivirgaceae bacterium]